MKYRSWLIVPGDSTEQIGKAWGSGADIVVIDLEDTVPPEGKAQARRQGAEWLSAYRTQVLEQRRVGRWVRVNALDSGHLQEDLAAVMPMQPDGIILPKALGPDAVRQLASDVYEQEQRHGIPANSTRIVPVVGETPLSAMRIADYLDTAHQRLQGFTWNAAGLVASLGAASARDEDGGLSDVCRFVRAQVLLMAHASRSMTIDAPFEDLTDDKGLTRATNRARRDGFSGMFALDIGQVAAINAAFTREEEELEEAREIIAAFEAAPFAGSLPFRGRTIDRTHLAVAQRLTHVASLETAPGNEGRRKPILRPA